MTPSLRSKNASAASMDYEDDRGLVLHRIRYQRCHVILDELQTETRPSDFAPITDVWVEHQMPLIVSPASSDLLRPIPVRVVDDAEDARSIVSLRWDDDDAVTVYSPIVASISEQEMDALRAEGARNPFGKEEEDAELLSVNNTEIFLRINSGSLYIKPVALRPADLIAFL